jgi:hypothetical protein
VVSLVRQRLPAPHPPADLHHLAGAGERRVEVDAVEALDDLGAGDAQTEREAAAGDVVEPGRGHGGQRRGAGVQLHHGREQLHPGRAGGQVAELADRVEAVRLGHRHQVGAGRLVLHHLVDGRREALAAVAELDAQPHQSPITIT